MEDEVLIMIGKGDGLWVIKNAPVQNKPNTEKWNGSIADQRDTEAIEGRNVSMLNSFMFL